LIFDYIKGCFEGLIVYYFFIIVSLREPLSCLGVYVLLFVLPGTISDSTVGSYLDILFSKEYYYMIGVIRLK
jgi:hypothetical protein